jgi:hypothetical protein
MKSFHLFGAGKVLTTILVLFLLSWVTLLSSCTATIRTPRHVRSTVVIQGQIGDDSRNHDRRSDRLERRERRNRQNHN